MAGLSYQLTKDNNKKIKGLEHNLTLVLKDISYNVDGEKYLENINLSFEPGSFNVLLGRTLAGKTSLMRVIAGLDKPNEGSILMDNRDVTGLAVQKRNVSMVYQQFINYPNMTVADNIASPLKLAGVSAAEIKKRVRETAELLHIETMLDRYPLELSGGQQQRCAMARALVKDADIILFDEPLVNLDYKLREALRSELKTLFKSRDCIAIYATTEAQEALALGGSTTLLHQGHVLQSGPAKQQYSRPVNLDAADLYHEPPLNLFAGKIDNGCLIVEQFHGIASIPHLAALPEGNYQFGVRCDHLSIKPDVEHAIELEATVDLAEISASETFLHLKLGERSWVAEVQGIKPMHTQTPIKVYLPLHKLFVFDQSGRALGWPERQGQSGDAHG